MNSGDLVRLKCDHSTVGVVIDNDVRLGWNRLQKMIRVVWSRGTICEYWTDSLEVINESR